MPEALFILDKYLFCGHIEEVEGREDGGTYQPGYVEEYAASGSELW